MLNRKTNTEKHRLITRRVFILAAAKIVIFAGISSRLFNLQISDKEKYEILSDKNRLREWKTPPERGFIIDYFNKQLASNQRVYQLHLVLDEVKNFDTTIFKIKNIINLNKQNLKEIYKNKNKLKPWDTLVVADNLSWDQFSKLNLFLHEIEGAKPVLSSSRYYPYSNDTVHIVGYVGDASVEDLSKKAIKENFVPGLKVGKYGIENSKEELLIGKYGIKRYEVNASGKRISQVDYLKETQGKEVKLTVDIEIQSYANELLKGKTGSICVMDIYTGEIIAMASSPTYDPNKFTHGISMRDWNEIKKNPFKPLINKSVAGLYSPGSTFKLLVALAALEYGVIDPNKPILCKGHKHPYELYGVKYHCWKKHGHGYMKLRNAIKQSCDIYFYETARILGVDKLSIIANRYGLGSKVLNGTFDDEKKGLVPTTKWKKNVLEKSWYLGETVINGIGQGYIQTTPLQLSLMTAQIANGGFKINPHIIYDESINYNFVIAEINKKMFKGKNYLKDTKYDFYERLYRNKNNINFIKDAMFGSTNEKFGTSFKSRHKETKYKFAGKTGTSQVRKITDEQRELDLDTSQIEYKNRDHALFVAFAPFESPRYSISVIIEHGGSGSKMAAPIANKIIKKTIDRHELREKINKEILKLA